MSTRGYTPLHDAANAAEALALLDAGAEVDAWSWDNRETPLLRAAFAHDLARVDLLLKRGAYVHWLAEDGETALTLAAGAAYARDDFSVCERLLQAGATVDLYNLRGECCRDFYPDLVERTKAWRLQKGAAACAAAIARPRL